ncbi:hypothetical protein COHA_004767 [Chlorella ohadii]|uniref:Alkaline phosphatase n=1 Tax=Chlorella ohadii TaxID=2649997 RepID=A0AAD5H701_9CHLO|nr:hypothetical protein COHA_004767 [Chlorella ohadii]
MCRFRCSRHGSGTFSTEASRDWTVAVDVEGLRPATKYFYRFSVGKLHSVVGETKTTASGHLEEMTFAQVCCSNWGFGRFHVYDLATRVDGLDFVLHCGYGKGYYPECRFQARHGLRPKHQCKTLDDFRQRYACYRTDPDLQELHRRFPWVCVWDDHEIADTASVTAFAEWVPVRGLHPGAPDLAGCHRTLHFGDLATLWEDGPSMQSAKEEFLAQLADPQRELIGAQQVADVRQAVQESVAAGRPWQVFLSQTVFSQLRAPKLGETVGPAAPPAGLDLQLMEAFSTPGCNAVVLAGDSHNAWAHELLDKRGRRVGVEFDAQAVTCPGFAEDIYSRFQSQARISHVASAHRASILQVGRLANLFPLYLFTPWVEDSLQAANPSTLRFCNLNQRGMVLHHVTHGRWHAEFHFVNGVTEKDYRNYVGAAFNVEQGRRGMLHRAFRHLTIDKEIPKRQQSKRSAFLRLLRGTRSIDKQP